MKKEIYIKNRGLAIASAALLVLCAAVIVAIRMPNIAALGTLLQGKYISYFIMELIDFILVPVCFVALALITAFFVKKRRISHPALFTVLPFLLTVYMLRFVSNVYLLFLLLLILPIIVLAAINIAKPAQMKIPLVLLLCAYSLTTAIFLTVVLIQQAVYKIPSVYWLYVAANSFVVAVVFPLALAFFFASQSPLLSEQEAYRRDTAEYYKTTSLATAIVLSIITFGVYSWYWKYRLCKKIKLMCGDRRSCTGEFLCVIFVPVYVFYWYYTRSKQICEIAKREGVVVEDISIPSLLLGLFGFQIISDALMQNELNNITNELICRATYQPQAPVEEAWVAAVRQAAEKAEEQPTEPQIAFEQSKPVEEDCNHCEQAKEPDETVSCQAEQPLQQCEEDIAANVPQAEEQQETAEVQQEAHLSEIEKLRQLKSLVDSGVLTEEEFAAKKAEILKRL